MQKPRKTLQPTTDRYLVGYLTWYCLNPTCPEAKWESGDSRFVTADHFDRQGKCKNRHKERTIE